MTSCTPGLSVPKPFPSCCPQTCPQPLGTHQLCSEPALGLISRATGWGVLVVGCCSHPTPCCSGFPGPSLGMQGAAVGETEAGGCRL